MKHHGPSIAVLNVAEAKKSFSDLLGRVAFGGETIVISRRGRPLAKLVPYGEERPRLLDVEGWLDEDDPFFSTVEGIVSGRGRRPPRVLKTKRAARRKRK